MVFFRYCCPLSLALLLVLSCSPTRYETYREPSTAVASWYGPEFHGKPTASGERFDMHALTCAHRELPFGAMIRVTNVSGDKSVECTVNDRGPFASGKDIDLSYAAAKEIGLVGSGTARVTIEYLGRDPRYVNEVRSVSSIGPFTIQVGSFQRQDYAGRLKSALDLKYGSVYIVETVISGATHYRVRIGKFPVREDAVNLAKRLAEEGYSPIIMHYDE
ncbi:MAG TPA: septal ring lytic transglycosylase RlpA family protein [Thermodesulfovibrionales bacterium]|nr:septal ring lytic transglycosylase RlpA family protein [Thermodesulfovibrionales bacterium]